MTSISVTVAVIFMSITTFLVNVVLGLLAILKNVFIPKFLRRRKVRKGEVVLITGGGGDLGRRIALKFAEKGATIISWDIFPKGNEETAAQIQQIGGKCYTYVVDLCDRNSVYKNAEMVRKQVGKVDVLINNAGIVSGKTFLDIPDEQIIKTFNVNAISHFWTTKSFLPEMLANNSGHIVTISSVAGVMGAGKMVDYCASKFAAVGFHESLHNELEYNGYDGVHSTVVCPYYIQSNLFKGVKSKLVPVLEPEYVANEIVDAILMNKVQVIMPTVIRWFISMKGLMSHSGISYAFSTFTGKEAMDMFVGAGQTKQTLDANANI